MPEYLKREELDALLAWPTPAISNAVELFNIRDRNKGFMHPQIRCQFPQLKPMIGYAVTGMIINFCKSDGFSIDGLKERYLSPRPAWPPR